MATYVYGVTTAPYDAPGRRGIDGERTRVLRSGDLCAIVASTDHHVVEARRENLMAHSDVLQDVVAARTVVPLRFGTLLAADDAVRNELLAARGRELASLLRLVDGHVEFSLKVYYVEDVVLSEILAKEPSIARLREAVASVPDDASYYQRIRLGELVAGALVRRRTADAAALATRLAPHAKATKEEGERPELMVMKGSFLVSREAVENFRAVVDELATQSGGRMIFKLVGPLPPYSFVEFEVEAGVVA